MIVTQKARTIIYKTIALPNYCILALSLFVFWVFTDDSDRTLSSNYFAFFANWFYWWSYFHSNSPLSKKYACWKISVCHHAR